MLRKNLAALHLALTIMDRLCIDAMLCFCRIAVFSIKVLRDERVITIAEQRPEATEEEVCTSSVGELELCQFMLSGNLKVEKGSQIIQQEGLSYFAFLCER